MDIFLKSVNAREVPRSKNLTPKIWAEKFDPKNLSWKIWPKKFDPENLILKIWPQKFDSKNLTPKIWLQKFDPQKFDLKWHWRSLERSFTVFLFWTSVLLPSGRSLKRSSLHRPCPVLAPSAPVRVRMALISGRKRYLLLSPRQAYLFFFWVFSFSIVKLNR